MRSFRLDSARHTHGTLNTDAVSTSFCSEYGLFLIMSNSPSPHCRKNQEMSLSMHITVTLANLMARFVGAKFSDAAVKTLLKLCRTLGVCHDFRAFPYTCEVNGCLALQLQTKVLP